jgi:predicted GIY-YIG superfamily endonuclease
MAIIYKITNLVNNKIYIGETIRSLNKRWNEHKS